MDQICFDTRRPRPTRLANKNCCYSNDRVHAIDLKEFDALEWTDFQVIFTISGCTAEYDQQVYYLPAALNCLLDQAYDGIEFLPGVIYFASRNAERLDTDGLLVATSDALESCFRTWTERFEVLHFDEAACKAKGWQIRHFDYVRNTEAVSELLDLLVRHSSLQVVAERMVRYLVRADHRPEDSAWLLEIAKAARDGASYYSFEYPDTKSKLVPANASEIQHILMNRDLLQREFNHTKDAPIRKDTCEMYWNGLADELGLAV
ncbi:MAG: hypothetical protein WC538_12665 [Thermoanaerobaculia bacterium]|jgi:hypothetical protein